MLLKGTIGPTSVYRALWVIVTIKSATEVGKACMHAARTIVVWRQRTKAGDISGHLSVYKKDQ